MAETSSSGQVTSRLQRIEGGVIGLLVGDALGVPYEFHEPGDIPPAAQIEFTPPPGYARSYPQVLPGTWSDDGAQALCLLASLLSCGRFDAGDFGQRLLRWRDDGYMAVSGDVFDIGITTNKALSAIKSGTPALQAGPSGHYDNGNGSLMRVLPLALWHAGTDAELVRDAQAQSRVTHGHRRSQVCCALYCLWARRILGEFPASWQSAVAALRALYAEDAAATEELEWSVRPDDLSSGAGSGYVVDSLRAAHWIIEREAADYAQGRPGRRRAGQRHRHTTACITGGIAGLIFGLGGIPQRWRGRPARQGDGSAAFGGAFGPLAPDNGGTGRGNRASEFTHSLGSARKRCASRGRKIGARCRTQPFPLCFSSVLWTGGVSEHLLASKFTHSSQTLTAQSHTRASGTAARW